MNIRDALLLGAVIVGSFLYFGYGYLYNDAAKQAKDIKACQSVGADWRYSDNNQVLCVRSRKECSGGY